MWLLGQSPMTDNEALNEAVRVLQRFESEMIGGPENGYPITLTFMVTVIAVAVCWQFGFQMWKLLLYIKNHKDFWVLFLAGLGSLGGVSAASAEDACRIVQASVLLNGEAYPGTFEVVDDRLEVLATGDPVGGGGVLSEPLDLCPGRSYWLRLLGHDVGLGDVIDTGFAGSCPPGGEHVDKAVGEPADINFIPIAACSCNEPESETACAGGAEPPEGGECPECGCGVLDIDSVTIDDDDGAGPHESFNVYAVNGYSVFPGGGTCKTGCNACSKTWVIISSAYASFQTGPYTITVTGDYEGPFSVTQTFPAFSNKHVLIGGPRDGDADGDCTGDPCDCDDDNDGTEDPQEDDDDDGTPNDEDDDDDDDGLDDNDEGEDDDEDGEPNCCDSDDDNDGDADNADCDWHGKGGGCCEDDEADEDGDEVPNNEDIDDDGDGVPDWEEDDDGDGEPNWEDTDDDGDSIPDEEDDDDGDGFPGDGSAGSSGADTDGDGTPDSSDTDDDGDGTPDDEDPDDDDDGTPDDEECQAFEDIGLGVPPEVHCYCDCTDGVPEEERPGEDPGDPGGEGDCECCDEIVALLERNNYTPAELDNEFGKDRLQQTELNSMLNDEGYERDMTKYDHTSGDPPEKLGEGIHEHADGLFSKWADWEFPFPAPGDQCNYEMYISFPYWGSSEIGPYFVNTLPTANALDYPELGLVWEAMDTLRVWLRVLLQVALIWRMWRIFADLIRSVL